MSLIKLTTAAALVLAAFWLPDAHAQRVDDGSDRFFASKVRTENDRDDTRVTQGSVISTTFVFRELGGDAVGRDPDLVDNYSGVTRLFTDLRLQLDNKRLDGKGWSVRTDARVRVSPGCDFRSEFNAAGNNFNRLDCRSQSGILGGNEYDIRELYAKRSKGKTDLYIGRQFVPELAATKVDGIKFHYTVSKRWQLLGFGGLNPSRISRSILTDYPKAQIQQAVVAAGQLPEDGAPILPATAGMGGAYRTPSLYGSLGVVGIVPLADDRDTQLGENPRVFLTDNGYWRPSNNLDLYHYAVFDLQSAAGLALTNLSLGANWRPKPGLTITAAVNRVDTETLNSITQTQILEAPINENQGLPYNFQNVVRVASQSANIGASLALARQRFEISARAFVRQREEVQLIIADNGMSPPQVLPAAESAEFRISVLDRRSVGGMRLGASFAAIVPIGNDTPNRSQVALASVTGSRLFMDDRLEYDLNLSLTSASDIKELGVCNDPINCYGNSDVMSVYTNNLLYYRFSSNWLGIVNLGVGIQRFTSDAEAQPINLLISGLLRAAYRF